MSMSWNYSFVKNKLGNYTKERRTSVKGLRIFLPVSILDKSGNKNMPQR